MLDIFRPGADHKKYSFREKNINGLLDRVRSKNEIYQLWDHSNRVSDISVALGKESGLGEECLNLLSDAAHLHDVGKTFLPDYLFTKDHLSTGELATIREHVRLGINAIGIRSPLSYIINRHHFFQPDPYVGYESLTYPKNSSPDLDKAQKMLAIADQVDALLSDRSYHKAWTPNAVFEYLSKTHEDKSLINLAIDTRNLLVK